ESYPLLRDFVAGQVGPSYKLDKGVISSPSNDLRGIDLGLITKFPLGRIISHRFNEFDLPDGRRATFSRDCLEVEVLLPDRSGILMTAYVVHLKSKYSRFDPVEDPEEFRRDQERSAAKREGELLEVMRIAGEARDPAVDRFAILGDFNDTPDSAALAPAIAPGNALGLVDSSTLIDAPDGAGGSSERRRPRDTHRWSRFDRVEGRRMTTYSQIDFILCSPPLFALAEAARVETRSYTTGSDHSLYRVDFRMP
ncbi:MAG: endonuclease/exonuclease/phosphatase family protein, partial [Rubricella sp.]